MTMRLLLDQIAPTSGSANVLGLDSHAQSGEKPEPHSESLSMLEE